jgi:hypothetical protein
VFKKALIGVAVPAALVAAIIAATGASAAPSGSMSLTARLDPKTLVMVDAARPRGRSAGDTVTFSTALVRDGKAAGRGEFAQMLADNRYQGIVIQGELLLADGTIALQGGGVNRRPPGGAAPSTENDMAVVGGTGAYAGASGTARLTDTGRTTQRVDITFTP